MGITGLCKYLDNNCQLQEKYLQDCSIVIDGNNLMYRLYDPQDSPVVRAPKKCSTHYFGADYTGFEERIRSFLSNLKACNIKPYIIFDGAYVPPPQLDVSDNPGFDQDLVFSKLQKKSLSRVQKLISENVTNSVPGYTYRPVLIKVK